MGHFGFLGLDTLLDRVIDNASKGFPISQCIARGCDLNSPSYGTVCRYLLIIFGQQRWQYGKLETKLDKGFGCKPRKDGMAVG